MQIGDNYLNGGLLLPERPRIYGQSATECRHAVLHTEITWASIPCHNGRVWHLAIVVSFEVPIANRHGYQRRGWSSTDDHPRRRGGRRCRWSYLYLTNVVARCLLFFLQNRYRRFADADSPMFQHAPMLPIFDVWCVHRPNSNFKKSAYHLSYTDSNYLLNECTHLPPQSLQHLPDIVTLLPDFHYFVQLPGPTLLIGTCHQHRLLLI